tara:strand:- start:67 stop:543 length:477 start_codon:yes stop_codon:yes gene_type:complete
MKYSEEELNIINEKRADLRKKPEPSTNTAIIEFIKKYELASKLPKNLTSQEWFSLKQKVLDHKDFPKFQTVYFNEITEHNQKINKKLEDPKMEKELDFLINKYSISERIRQFINPLPPYSKYQKNYKVREEKKLNKIDMFLWSIFIIGLSIVLIIFIF